MTRFWRLFFIFLALTIAFLTAMYFLGQPPAPPKNLIVLMEDPDGTTGAADVISKGGSQTLSKAGQATGTSSADEKPRTPYFPGDAEINGTFGGVLRARAELPASFTIYFQPNSNLITAPALTQIIRIADEVRRRQVASVSIYGHSDNTGDAAIALALSLDRAAAVRDALTAQGLDTAAFSIESFGDRDQLVPAAPGVQEPLNRRVEVVVR